MLDGKANKFMSGGNRQRESFKSKAMGSGKVEGGTKNPVKAEHAGNNAGEGESTTTITHHGDGTHTVQHHDGETTEHPNHGHMLMTIHAKHAEGPGAHIHAHPEGGATTHHVGHDGMVEGPHDHASVDEGAEHVKQMIGEDGQNGSLNMTDGEDGGMPGLY
jgi:hypothetical protein